MSDRFDASTGDEGAEGAGAGAGSPGALGGEVSDGAEAMSPGVRIASKELLSSGMVAKPSGWMVSTGAAGLFLVEEASPDDPATRFPQPENVVRMITQDTAASIVCRISRSGIPHLSL
jgi:hypothetical protein